MYAPAASCIALYRLHKWLRLAWAGRPAKPGELNVGDFAVVQLYHVSDVGPPDDPLTYRTLWTHTIAPGSTGEKVLAPIDRGPVFNRLGGTERDWDPLRRVPVFVALLDGSYHYPDGTPVRLEDVFSGKFLLAIHAWLRPIQDRIIRNRKQRTLDIRSKAEDLGHEMTDFVWNRSPQDALVNNRPREDRRFDEAKLDYLKQNDGLADIFESTKVQGTPMPSGS